VEDFAGPVAGILSATPLARHLGLAVDPLQVIERLLIVRDDTETQRSHRPCV